MRASGRRQRHACAAGAPCQCRSAARSMRHSLTRSAARLKRQLRANMRRGANPLELRRMERLYHHAVRAKRRAHRLAQLRSLIMKLRSDPRAFWKRLKSQHADMPEQLKSVQAWDAYLARVAHLDLPAVAALPLSSFPVLAQPYTCSVASALAALQAPITIGEVLTGLQHLRNSRSCGMHGLPAELLRYAKAGSTPGSPASVNVLAPVLASVLNAAFHSGTVPAALNTSLVTPVHKKGSKVDPLNYRPIAVAEPVLRLYAGILNARIVAFTEGAALRADTQAGFRPGQLHCAPAFHLAALYR